MTPRPALAVEIVGRGVIGALLAVRRRQAVS
jgi:hypothetical protein